MFKTRIYSLTNIKISRYAFFLLKHQKLASVFFTKYAKECKKFIIQTVAVISSEKNLKRYKKLTKSTSLKSYLIYKKRYTGIIKKKCTELRK